jgi:hypothetical protein
MTSGPPPKPPKPDKTPAAATRAAAQRQYWQRVEDAILEAMKSLPLRDFEDDEPSLRTRAHWLSQAAGWALFNRHPRANKTRGKDGLKREARAIRDTAAKLHRLLEAAHGDTLAALERAAETDPQIVPMPLHPLAISEHLRALANLAHVAELDAPAQPAQPGTPRKLAVAQVADLVLQSFEQLTGKRAARAIEYKDVGQDIVAADGGPFIAFLGAVFAALGLNDSPASQGRDAIARAHGEKPPKK